MATVEEQLSKEQREAMQSMNAARARAGMEPIPVPGASTTTPPRMEVPRAQQETSAALKALVAARAEQVGLGDDDQQEVLDLSVQARAAPTDVPESTSAIWWFRSSDAGEISPWWSEKRDQDLREFWMREGNDILQGANTSMVKKFRAMNWALEGPEEKVKEMQQVLSQAEFGQGWGSLLGKTITDYNSQDKGAFWELIGEGDPDGPLQGLPVGVAHLDSGLCQLTGDPVYPVLFRNTKDVYCPQCGRKYARTAGQTTCKFDNTELKPMMHRLHATRVVHLVDMPSPNESMNNVGFCAVSRVIASSLVLLKLARYKNEKLSDLPQAGLLLLNNILPKQWETITKGHEKDRRKLGHEIWSNIMVLMGLDPERPVSADFLNFAQLPDQFNEKEATELYINIVALAFGVDVREFWPMTAGNLGTATETLIMHQKAKGKGVGDLISTLERAINWHIMPESVTFSFDFTDDDEDLARATLDEVRTKTILSMYLPDPNTGETLASKDEVRQMLADNVTYFPEDFLEIDTTTQTSADDTQVKAMEGVRARYGPIVVIDRKGKITIPRGYRLLGQKGGPGSGNWRHTGLTGVHGGSDEGEGLGKIYSWGPDETDVADKQLKGWFHDWATGLAEEERDAVFDWVGSYYDNVNDVMRGQKSIRDYWGDAQLKVEETVPRLDSLLDKASMPLTVSTKRAICRTAKCVEVYGALEPGDEFTDNGYVATGLTGVPGGWDRRPIQANVIIPRGSKAAYLDATGKGRDEFEVLIQRGARFRVVGKRVEKTTVSLVTTAGYIEEGQQIILDIILMAQGETPPVPFEPRFAPSLYEGKKAGDQPRGDRFTWELGDITIFKKGEKGGPGSGHHGHAGRPGQVGGSAPGKGAGSIAPSISSDLGAFTFKQMAAHGDRTMFVETAVTVLAEDLGFDVDARVMDRGQFDSAIAKAASTAGIHPSQVAMYYRRKTGELGIRREKIDSLSSPNEFRVWAQDLFHELGHGYSANVMGTQASGVRSEQQYWESREENFARAFGSRMATVWDFARGRNPKERSKQVAKDDPIGYIKATEELY